MADLRDLKYLFHRKPVNAYQASEWRGGEKIVKWYRHPDLYAMAKEAFEKGEDCFYCVPANKDNPNGHLVSSGPVYRYELHLNFSEEEFENLFGKWDVKEFIDSLKERARLRKEKQAAKEAIQEEKEERE